MNTVRRFWKWPAPGRRPTDWSCALGWSLAVLSGAPSARPAPAVAEAEEVLDVLVEPEGLRAWRTREAARLRCRATPGDAYAVLEYVRLCVDAFRAGGDPRHLSHAEGAMGRWWDLESPPPELRLWRAIIRQGRHRFGEARQDLEMLVQGRPEMAQGWLTLSAVLLVTGEVKEARLRCEPLRELAGDFIFTVADAAAAGMGGDAESSRRRLQSLLAESTPVSPDLRAWACGTLADICERLGQRAEAESCHRAARVLAPDLPHHLAAWADFLLAEGRWREAADLLQPHRENDLLGLRWACAKARLGEWDGLYADTVISLRAGERAAAARGEHGHAREEAMLYLELLDEPDIALARALRNWKCQREPLDARLVVACARAAGRPSAAAPVLSWRRHTGMEDVVLDRMLKLLEATP